MTAEASALQNREAEQVVLGCAILEAETVMPQLAERLVAEHFYFRAHRTIYQTLMELFKAGQPIDLITLGNRLEERSRLAEVGGRAYLSELVSAVTTTTSVGYYADIVVNRYRQREIVRVSEELAERAARAENLNGQLASYRDRLDALLVPPDVGQLELTYFERLPENAETEWLVEEFLAHPRLVGLGGKRASFKTWTALHVALAVSSGAPVFGRYQVTQPGNVLYLNGEGPPELIAKWLQMLAAQTGPPPEGSLAIANFLTINLRSPAGVARFKRLLEKTTPQLVVIDALARIWGVEEEFHNVQVAEAMESLRKLCADFETTILFLHHLRKAPTLGKDAGDILETMRGGSEIVNLSDSVFVLRRRGEEPCTLVRHGKHRDGSELEPFKIRLTVSAEGESAALTWENAATDSDSETESCAHAILTWLEEQATGYRARTGEIQNVMKDAGYSKRTVTRALKYLVEEGVLDKPQRGCYVLTASTGQLGGDFVGGGK